MGDHGYAILVGN